MGWQLFRDRTNGATHRGELVARTQAGPDEAFWASPLGRATRARMRGDRFFQIALADETLAAYAEDHSHDSAHDSAHDGAHHGAHQGGGRRARRAGDLLGQIEDLGWRLEHVSWWRSGAVGAERVSGVYLFHAAPEAEANPTPGTTNGVSRSPSHRRNDS